MTSNCTVRDLRCHELVTYIGYSYVFTGLCVLGVCSNALNICVLARRADLRGTSFTFLLCLAVVDFTCCLLLLPLGLLRCLRAPQLWKHYVRHFYSIYVNVPVCNAFAACSVWTTLVMSYERYASVRGRGVGRQPGGGDCLSRSPRRTVTALFFMSLALHTPYFFHRYIDPNDPRRLVVTRFGQSDGFRAYLWIRMSLTKFVPIVAVAVVNGLLLKMVINATKRHKGLSSQKIQRVKRQRAQVRVTLLLICVCVIFLVCHFPEPFAHGAIYRSLFGACSLQTVSYRRFLMTTNILEVFSFAVNFFPYVVFIKPFRKRLCEMFSCQRCPNRVHCDDMDPGRSLDNNGVRSEAMNTVYPANVKHTVHEELESKMQSGDHKSTVRPKKTNTVRFVGDDSVCTRSFAVNTAHAGNNRSSVPGQFKASQSVYSNTVRDADANKFYTVNDKTRFQSLTRNAVHCVNSRNTEHDGDTVLAVKVTTVHSVDMNNVHSINDNSERNVGVNTVHALDVTGIRGVESGLMTSSRN